MLAALLLFVVLWSDPFVRIFPPAIEGRDLNPMLQHPGLIFHPPLLYLGYGGLMVAASVALAWLLWRPNIWALGLLANARAIATRCFCPPERFDG